MDLRNSGNHILKDCMGLREGESVLIITDDLMPDSIPGSLFQAAIDAGFDPLIMKMKSRSVPGEEPLDAIASVMPEYRCYHCTDNKIPFAHSGKAECLKTRKPYRNPSRHN